jgi:hypothetical protein
MAHETDKSGPCGLPDGHNGYHRSLEGKARYDEARARWQANNPVKRALADAKYEATRRGHR